MKQLKTKTICFLLVIVIIIMSINPVRVKAGAGTKIAIEIAIGICMSIMYDAAKNMSETVANTPGINSLEWWFGESQDIHNLSHIEIIEEGDTYVKYRMKDPEYEGTIGWWMNRLGDVLHPGNDIMIRDKEEFMELYKIEVPQQVLDMWNNSFDDSEIVGLEKVIDQITSGQPVEWYRLQKTYDNMLENMYVTYTEKAGPQLPWQNTNLYPNLVNIRAKLMEYIPTNNTTWPYYIAWERLAYDNQLKKEVVIYSIARFRTMPTGLGYTDPINGGAYFTVTDVISPLGTNTYYYIDYLREEPITNFENTYGHVLFSSYFKNSQSQYFYFKDMFEIIGTNIVMSQAKDIPFYYSSGTNMTEFKNTTKMITNCPSLQEYRFENQPIIYNADDTTTEVEPYNPEKYRAMYGNLPSDVIPYKSLAEYADAYKDKGADGEVTYQDMLDILKEIMGDAVPQAVIDAQIESGENIADIEDWVSTTYRLLQGMAINIDNINSDTDNLGVMADILTQAETSTQAIDNVASKLDELVQAGTITKADVVAALEQVKAQADAKEVEIAQAITNQLTIDNLKMRTGITAKFPFCIPFDFVDMLKTFQAEPKVPVFDIPLNVKAINYDGNIHIDLSMFEPLTYVTKPLMILLFCISLALLTRNIIKG